RAGSQALPLNSCAKDQSLIGSSRRRTDKALAVHPKTLSSVSAETGRTRRTSRTAAGARTACRGLRLHRQQAFALQPLARELTRPADRFRLLARFLFRGFFVMAAELHLAENALALHLLLQRLKGLVDIVVTDENLHAGSFSFRFAGLH